MICATTLPPHIVSIANLIEGLQDFAASGQVGVMRAPLMTLVLLLGLPFLAGCQLALPGRADTTGPKANPITVGEVQVTSLDAPAAAPITAPAPAVAAPASTPQVPQPAAPAPVPEAATPPEVPSIPVSPQALECMSTGGTWGRVGDTIVFSCVRQTRDAGKSCRRQTDCETECLARSRTCAPITPMFGCNPVLQADGREVTLCID